MKRTLTAMVVILALVLATTSCGGGAPKPVDPLKAYPSYGIFNEDTDKSQNVCYKMSPLSVILSIIFIETVIVPVYLVGWDLWDPYRIKTGPTDNCNLGR